MAEAVVGMRMTDVIVIAKVQKEALSYIGNIINNSTNTTIRGPFLGFCTRQNKGMFVSIWCVFWLIMSSGLRCSDNGCGPKCQH